MVPKEEGERRVDEVDVECKVKDNERTAGAVKEANAGSGDVEEEEEEAKQGELEQVCDAREWSEDAFAEGESVGEFVSSVTDALLRMFRDAADSAHYTTDYMTKENPNVGDVLPEQALGIERLVAEGRARQRRGGDWGSEAGADLHGFLEADVHAGCRALIRLQTSANRASLKKLPEMMFQFLMGHECFMSHRTYTLFCKGLVRLAYVASRARQAEAMGVAFHPTDAVEPEWPGVDEE